MREGEQGSQATRIRRYVAVAAGWLAFVVAYTFLRWTVQSVALVSFAVAEKFVDYYRSLRSIPPDPLDVMPVGKLMVWMQFCTVSPPAFLVGLTVYQRILARIYGFRLRSLLAALTFVGITTGVAVKEHSRASNPLQDAMLLVSLITILTIYLFWASASVANRNHP